MYSTLVLTINQTLFIIYLVTLHLIKVYIKLLESILFLKIDLVLQEIHSFSFNFFRFTCYYRQCQVPMSLPLLKVDY